MYEAKCLVMDYHTSGGGGGGAVVAASAGTGPQGPPSVPAGHVHQFHQLHPLAPDTSARWTQYQQLWRQHHMYINGMYQSFLIVCLIHVAMVTEPALFHLICKKKKSNASQHMTSWYTYLIITFLPGHHMLYHIF
ncbi:hypothetical protein O3M35_002926 [Rhynocoris fuscipes]|uniref:Uncharacterized protein n=1 Tax=Rhynocoris fuscipes TaxID=488301 RepID=A0AAW1CT80_9HEMI